MIAALGAAMLFMCGTAQAAGDGDLYIDGCVARSAGVAGCPAGLQGLPIGVAASPDGRHLYAGMHASGGGSFHGLQIFDRNPQNGVATPRAGAGGCIASLGAGPPCTPLGISLNLSDAFDITVSPDGFNVYMVAFNRTMLNFARDPGSGSLTYVNCVGPAPCAPLTGGAAAQSVAVSPESQHVYLRTHIGLAVLDRVAAGGAIVQKPTFAGCFSEGNVDNCTDVDGLAGNGYNVAVSPDGANVYVAFDSPGGVAVFRRSSDGTLAQTTGPAGGCISANRASGGTGNRCVDGNDGLTSTYTLTVSADGRSVYAGGLYGITSFLRDRTTGALTESGCNGPIGTCTRVAPELSAVFSLAVTPDGGEVIAGAHGSESVVSFIRNGGGTLTQRPGRRGCLTRTGNGNLCLTLPLLDNDHHVRLAMDHSGLRFYVASRAGMLATITRDYAPTCQPLNVDTAFNTLVSVPLRCTDANNDPLTILKRDLPAAGQLGEIVNGSVFYSPFANFIGADSFTYYADSPDREGLDGPAALVTVNVAGPVAAPSANPSGLDSDRDGFFAGQDCNDANAAIRPGAVEVKGNRTDENCDGTAEPFPTLTSGVVSKWDVKGGRLTLTTLQVTQQFPRGWKARIICRGKPKCTFASKTLKAGKVRRGAAAIISSLSRRQRVFRAGQTVEIWVTAPNFNTKVARLVLKRNRIPLTEPFCVLPGSTRVQKTCT